ncbi:uncharacterized protein N7498_004125 [Penicillium cinerascens]|uniref:gamma-glutamylcyclotransferase n=1 Tax=Penicillium cinerascens TaxID=70096 RepID=A0A9W9T7S6_9EURO|nr:uncharacterized protein N7498_004125 [Penicillium cinerascens]KAJ5212479.1 hypothetical protein N7498_004125 [Penicillium cinerascens]
MAPDGHLRSISDPESGYLHFAYGSNMHLKQMAQRCPESVIFAKGALRNYKWQTNSRGGGNVLLGNADDVVHGIVFKIPSCEIEALRRYEGVDKQFFVEQKLVIELEAISDPELSRQKTVDVVEVLAKQNSDHGQHDISATMRPARSNEICQAETRLPGSHEALVYISTPMYSSPGTIRDEYRRRMQLAIADARFFGLSEDYLTCSLGPLISCKDTDA